MHNFAKVKEIWILISILMLTWFNIRPYMNVRMSLYCAIDVLKLGWNKLSFWVDYVILKWKILYPDVNYSVFKMPRIILGVCQKYRCRSSLKLDVWLPPRTVYLQRPLCASLLESEQRWTESGTTCF